MNSYNLPLFMSIGTSMLDDLPQTITKEYPEFSNAKKLLLTTPELLNIFENRINCIIKNISNIELLFVKESSFEFAVELAKHICTDNIKMVIGFGGGTVLDTAKYAAFVSKTTYIVIPTALSNDGLASPIAVLYAQNNRRKSFGAKIPDGIVIDTDIISGAPEILLKAGVGDTISNYTALYDWKMDCNNNGTKLNDFAYMLSEMSFNSLLYSKNNSLKSMQCLKMIAESLVLSGLAMQIAGNSRPCSGSEHLFSHAVDELFDLKIPHGILVAFGSIVACTLQQRDNFILLDYLDAYNISVNPRNIGINKEQFVTAWLSAKETRKERYTVLNTICLTESMLSEIYNNLLEVCK